MAHSCPMTWVAIVYGVGVLVIWPLFGLVSAYMGYYTFITRGEFPE